MLVGPVSGEREIISALEHGGAKVVLRIPSDFSSALAQGREVAVQAVLDGSDSYVAILAMSYAQNIILQYDRERAVVLAGSVPHLNHMLPEIRLVSRAWYNPTLDFSHYNIVIMLALAVPLVGILLAAAAFARERESGTLERLAISPVRPWEILLAKTIPTAGLALIGMTIGIIIAVAIVHAPLRGNVTFFYLASLVAFVASGAIGVIVATLARTIQQALLGAFFVLFPLLFLSGTITPIENMPAAMRIATFASPVRYFGEIAIGVFFRGASPFELGSSVLGLLILTTILVAVALRRIAAIT
jgi:ABC-2 type transport system permease protein